MKNMHPQNLKTLLVSTDTQKKAPIFDYKNENTIFFSKLQGKPIQFERVNNDVHLTAPKSQKIKTCGKIL